MQVFGISAKVPNPDAGTWGMKAGNGPISCACSRAGRFLSLGDVGQLRGQAAQGFPRVLRPLGMTQALDDAVNRAGGSDQTHQEAAFVRGRMRS